MRLILPILCILFVILTAHTASALPEITDWNNSITQNKELTFAVDNGVTVTFNVLNVSESVNEYKWYVDNSEIINNDPTFLRSWTEPFIHNVKVEVITASGNDTITWTPTVQRQKAITTSETINETPLDELYASMEGDGDFERFFAATTLPYIYAIGQFFFVFIVGLYFAMVWTRQENILVPASVGLIVGIVLFAFLPETFYVGTLSLILLSASGIVFNLYKER